jgi:small subunit ribosomal protein S8
MDHIANMLIQLKNAGTARKPHVVVSFSNIKLAIAKLLEREGYVASVSETKTGSVPAIKIDLAYKDREHRIHDVKRISKLSRRMYSKVSDLRPFKYGHGMVVLSTPKGILSDKEAKKEMVGGEVLFSIW